MSEFNEDELTAPAWLNENFFLKVLKCMEKSDNEMTIHSLHIEPASKRGDHYASVMFRVTIAYDSSAASNRQRQTVIVKTLPAADSAKGRNLHATHFMANEAHIYSVVIPKFEAIWRRYGENVKFSGRLLYAERTPHAVIVLEDLCLSGYDILRRRLFHLDEVKACLGKLAQWHAVSHKVSEESRGNNNNNNNKNTSEDDGGSSVTQLQRGLFTANSLMNTAYMHNGLRNMIAALERAGGGFEAYLPKLRAMEPVLLARCLDMNNAYGDGLRGPIYVLNHGDFHTKNLMIRQRQGRAEGEVADLLFIDFQASFFGPSCADLQYLCITLFDRTMRDEKRDELFRFYFQCFQASLRKLQFSGRIPSYADFEEDCRRWRHFEIYLLATNLPLTALNPAKDPNIDINLIFNSAEYRETFYHNPDYINYLRELLPKYLKTGYLD